MLTTTRYAEWIHRGNLHGVWGAVVTAGLFALGHAVGFPGMPASLWAIPAAGVVGFATGKIVGLAVLGASGRAARSVYMPHSPGTYAQTHSQIDTMEARGDYRGAAAAWEAVAVSQPMNPWPLIRAGELYMRSLGEPEMSLDRFRHARKIHGVAPEQARYAAQKIIDLYLGPLADEGKAMVEMRKLIERHPGTPEAEGARSALARRKAARGESEAG